MRLAVYYQEGDILRQRTRKGKWAIVSPELNEAAARPTDLDILRMTDDFSVATSHSSVKLKLMPVVSVAFMRERYAA